MRLLEKSCFVKTKAVDLRLCRALDRAAGLSQAVSSLRAGWLKARPGVPSEVFSCRQNCHLTCGNKPRKIVFPLSYLRCRPGKRVHLLGHLGPVWTDGLFEPSDEHDGIVPSGTAGDVPLAIVALAEL